MNHHESRQMFQDAMKAIQEIEDEIYAMRVTGYATPKLLDECRAELRETKARAVELLHEIATCDCDRCEMIDELMQA